MPMIEGFRVKNFRSLKDITLGKLWNDKKSKALTPLIAVIGKNGVGKSTLFDAFGFLSDCLKVGVEAACDLRNRGGFNKIHSFGVKGPIEFEIYYRESRNSRPITYEISIDIDKNKRPYVLNERLRQRRKNQRHGRPFSFLFIQKGRGIAWKGNSSGSDNDYLKEGDIIKYLEEVHNKKYSDEESKDTEVVELEDIRKLGISTLGSLKQHPRISAFRKFLENWYLSYFTSDSARSLPLAGAQKHLNTHGDNLGNVVQFMEREHPQRFMSILNNISQKIPGINKISTEKSSDGRLLLKFNDKGFQDPFFSQQMSDGTLKIFAYLLLLEDPTPPPFICIEEPENGLYHKLLETLALELREHAAKKRGAAQIFITTHQPYLINSLSPEEVWILRKDDTGFSSIKRASDDELINNLVNEGIPLGSLWYSDYLDER